MLIEWAAVVFSDQDLGGFVAAFAGDARLVHLVQKVRASVADEEGGGDRRVHREGQAAGLLHRRPTRHQRGQLCDERHHANGN